MRFIPQQLSIENVVYVNTSFPHLIEIMLNNFYYFPISLNLAANGFPLMKPDQRNPLEKYDRY